MFCGCDGGEMNSIERLAPKTDIRWEIVQVKEPISPRSQCSAVAT